MGRESRDDIYMYPALVHNSLLPSTPSYTNRHQQSSHSPTYTIILTNSLTTTTMISPDIQRLPIPILKKIVADLSLKDLDSLIEVGGNFGRVARSEKQRRELEGGVCRVFGVRERHWYGERWKGDTEEARSRRGGFQFYMFCDCLTWPELVFEKQEVYTHRNYSRDHKFRVWGCGDGVVLVLTLIFLLRHCIMSCYSDNCSVKQWRTRFGPSSYTITV